MTDIIILSLIALNVALCVIVMVQDSTIYDLREFIKRIRHE